MRKFFLSLIVFSSVIADDGPVISYVDHIEPAAMPTGTTDIISGQYYESHVDYVVQCAQPIPIERAFLEKAWQLQVDRVDTYIGKKGKNPTFWLKEGSGKWLTFAPTSRWSFWGWADVSEWGLYIANYDGICNTSSGSLSGKNNVKNLQLKFRLFYGFLLQTGAGETRNYKLIGEVRQEKYHHIHRRSNKYHLKEKYALERVVLPNGNRILYHYDDQARPISIKSTDATEKNTFGWATLRYHDSNVTIQTSDGRHLEYCGGDALTRVTLPGSKAVTYSYDTSGYIVHSSRPNARAKRLTYDHDRVIKEEAPVGLDDTLITTFRYEYPTTESTQRIWVAGENGHWEYRTIVERIPHTKVWDAYDNLTVYHFDDHNRITKIVRPDGSEIHQRWGDCATKDSIYKHGVGARDETNLLSRSFRSPEGDTLYERIFIYDDRGNVLQEKLIGDLEHVKEYTYSDDGFNLTLSETNGDYTIWYEYQPRTNLLTRKWDSLGKEETYAYDNNAALTRQTLSWGTENRERLYTNGEDGLPRMIEERCASGRLRTTHLTYDEHNQIIQCDVYDAEGTYRHTTTTDYNEQGYIISQTDPLAQQTNYTYDINGNRTSIETGIQTTFTYDFSDRLIAVDKTDDTGDHLSNRYTYDYLHRKTSETDSSGNATHFEYDCVGNLIKVIHPPVLDENGLWITPEVTYTYDALGNQISETDENGYTTRREYNCRKQVTAIYHPDNTCEYFAYLPNGHLKKHTDKNGTSTLYTRDGLGRILTQQLIAPDGTILSETRTTYDGRNIATTTDAEGHVTHFSYDSAGRLIEQTIAHQTISYTYDSLGRKASERIADKITLYSYDLLNRLIEERVEDASGTLHSLIQYAYDREGNKIRTTTYQGATPIHHLSTYNLLNQLTSTTDPLGHTTHIHYNRSYLFQNRSVLLLTTTEPDGTQTVTLHDPRGNPIRTEKKDPFGETIALVEYLHDPSGNKLQETHTVYPTYRTVTTRWTYGPNSRLEKLHEACGSREYRVTAYRYNQYGQLAATIKPSGQKLIRTYDSLGRLHSHTGPYFSYTYTYDGNDNVIETSSPNGTTTRTFDPHQNLLSETLETGLTLSFTYDEQNRRTSTTLPDGTRITYAYDATHLLSITHRNHTHHYLDYDLSGNLLSERHSSGQISNYTYDLLNRTISRSSPHFSETNITYDAIGNLLSINEETYTYDALNQLASEPDHTYTYDSLHNRLSHNTETYTHNALNQPRHLPYDADGRLLSKDSIQYTYDGLDRLIRVQTPSQTINYTYDAFNRRLTANDAQFLYTGKKEIGAVTDDTITQLRILGNGRSEIGTAVLIELDGSTYIPIHDRRGSVSRLLSLSGELWESYTYTAYGECEIHTSASFYNYFGLSSSHLNNPYQFLSKRRDTATDLIFFGLRHYDPSLGLWITPDPSGYDQGPNLYTYALNNPLRYYDLWGLAAEEQDQGILSTIFNFVCGTCDVIADGFRTLWDTFTGDVYLRDSHNNPTYDCSFDDRCKNQPTIFHLGRPEPPNSRLYYYHGMDTSYEDALEAALYFSNLVGGYNVYAVHNPSNGFFSDLWRCCRSLYGGKCGAGIKLLHENMKEFFQSAGPEAKAHILCHSEGGAHVKVGARYFDNNWRDHVSITGVACAGYARPQHVGDLTYIRSTNDPIGYLCDVVGVMFCQRNVVDVKPHPDADHFDHGIMSPTYTDFLERELSTFIKMCEEKN